MVFNKESDFEDALIKMLTESCGWEKDVLCYKTESDLIRNWANILFENNRSIDRLNNYPLTDSEMQQIIEQIKVLASPLRLNGFINGRSVSIKRDNPDDVTHFGKEISLKIYDRDEIAAGQSRYQIARQPIFTARSSMLPDRRGDFMLLINGMPVIHVELKKSGIPVSQAYSQIEKYSREGVFTGLFSLVQVFVAMQPDETVYFANPGPEGRFNKDYYFHWANANNDTINDWKAIARELLSIPMAHQLIGFYTVADKNDGVLKVMRSYQYFAATRISDVVTKHDWESGNQRGGYIWHTTGSGKTMTSFKSAQLIANSKDADKVVFLLDRIELGTQSLDDYRGFADEKEAVQSTEDTVVLVSKLKSSDSSDTLIVTSIQKMSNIKRDSEAGLKKKDIDIICSKRVVFIVDECHRSTFGDMMHDIKETFPKALFFGFTGTPIDIENSKKGCTTATVFGAELHRYSIADGIRDKNVLGFDPDMVLTFREKDMRTAVALDKAKAKTVEEAISDPNKRNIFYRYMDSTKVPMAGFMRPDGNYSSGIEDYMLESGQYRTPEHQQAVVSDILDNWLVISHNRKFHGLFATSSIQEAIQYYHLFKEKSPHLNITALFDPSIDNSDAGITKEDALKEIIEDYDRRYKQCFTIPSYARMKKDIQNRLSHGGQYQRVEKTPDEQIDLLIVVDQMLTGYDSKWLNVLYLDKILTYENIIQAFSRTNRLFGEDKPFGCIKYYRAPYTMKRNIDVAVAAYSGNKPLGLFVEKLDKNLIAMNRKFEEIGDVFASSGIDGFECLPPDVASCKKFASLFREFNEYLEAAKVQGFTWKKLEYRFKTEGEETTITVNIDETTYLILVLRYKELFSGAGGSSGVDSPYDLDGYITTIDTDVIDSDYMDSKFVKFRKALDSRNEAEITQTREELHKTFATLGVEEQKFATLVLHDMQNGDLIHIEGYNLRDYINEYMKRAKNDQIHKLAESFGLNEDLLRQMISVRTDEATINEYGRLDALKSSVDPQKARMFFETKEGKKLPTPKINIKLDKMLRDFIINGGFEINTGADGLKKIESGEFTYSSSFSDMPMVAEDEAPYGHNSTSR